MGLETRPGPWKRAVQIFDLEDLDHLNFNPERVNMGFFFISEGGKIHLELGHVRLSIGSFLELLFCPRRHYRKFGRDLADLSLLKGEKRLMGGTQFLFNAQTREFFALAVGLVPPQEVPQAALEERRTAFRKLGETFDRLAIKIGAVVAIAATDHVPPEKMALIGWRPYKHTSLRDSLRHRWLWFPIPVRHFYSKKYPSSDPGV